MAKKILIIEDDEYLVDSYRSTLETEDYEVMIARDGEEGVEKALSLKPDVIILDIVMPKKGGIEVLKELKSKEGTKNIPVLMASNIDQKETVKKALALGAKEYFIKSNISIDELVERVKKYIV